MNLKLPILQRYLLSSYVSPSFFMSHSPPPWSHSFWQGTPSLDSFSALSAMVFGDTGSSGTARREDIFSLHPEPFWTLSFALATRNELLLDNSATQTFMTHKSFEFSFVVEFALDLGPSNRCSSSSSSRTLTRPVLTLQENTSFLGGTTVDRKRWKK